MKKYVTNIFLKLAKLFKQNGFELYLVGGSARDYILGRDTEDLDLATDALVEDMLKIIPQTYNVRTPFKKYGNIKISFDSIQVDITTLREESDYDDSRHPSKITFVKELEKDSNRRDFTINALYLDSTLKSIFDYHDGVDDLVSFRIKMIGDPKTRIKEDPLRIIRALRFALKLNFTIEPELDEILRSSITLLKKLTPQKVDDEIDKMRSFNLIKANEVLRDYKIIPLKTKE